MIQNAIISENSQLFITLYECFQGIISLIVWGDEIRFGMIKSNKARREERELIGLILHDWYRYW